MTTNNNICSVSWMNSEGCLAIGQNDGSIILYDSVKMSEVRRLTGHADRVGSLSWNSYILSSGSKDTKIINHDVRVRNHMIHTLSRHTGEVCSLKWSPDGTLLASGGNDNLVCIWDINVSNVNNNTRSNNLSRQNSISNNINLNGRSNFNSFTRSNSNLNIESNINLLINENEGYSDQSDLNSLGGNFSNNNRTNIIAPKFIFADHKSAVKAMSWCPWQKGLLATGGGAKDMAIKFWNTQTGTLLSSVDTGSQVCTLHWTKQEEELISSHGYSKNQICVWKYPTMFKVAELLGHKSRVLYTALSPDGCTLVSGSGDEALCFWKIYDEKPMTQNSNEFDFNYKSASQRVMNSFQIR